MPNNNYINSGSNSNSMWNTNPFYPNPNLYSNNYLNRNNNNYSSYNYGYNPMYERGNSSSYGYRRPMYYTDEDDLMIRKHDMYENQNMR